MKTPEAKQAREQIKLPLFEPAASATIPADKQHELAHALMELLLNAAHEYLPNPNEADKGGTHDEPSQAHS
jgi:anti-sigma regulatory factor (Ser/Thr protein kinase)